MYYCKVFGGGNTQGNSQQQLRSATLEQTTICFYHSLLKGRCLGERYKYSVMHSANLQFTAKTVRLKTMYRLYPKEQEPRHCPNSQKCLLLTKEPASATGCDSKVLRLSTPSCICFLSAIWNMLASTSSNTLFKLCWRAEGKAPESPPLPLTYGI